MRFYKGDSRGRGGFSLIEVLVASTILIVIVMMVMMVFQQSIGTWSSGSRRADSQMVVRTIIGSIQRDLANAVPGYDGDNFSGNTLIFHALVGDPDSDAADGRAVQKIEYSYDGGKMTRKATYLGDSGPHSELSFIDKATSEFTLTELEFSHGAIADNGLPMRVDIRIKASSSGLDGMVAAHSLGPDGRRDTSDDIYVGTIE